METQRLITSLCTWREEKSLPTYNTSSDDIILTVTTNRLLIICAEHYARKLLTWKCTDSLYGKEREIRPMKLLQRKKPEEKIPVNVEDRGQFQASPGRDGTFLDCPGAWWSRSWAHHLRLEKDWTHSSCWLQGWCSAAPLDEVRNRCSASVMFSQKRLALLLPPPAVLLEGMLKYLAKIRLQAVNPGLTDWLPCSQ